MFKKKTYKNEGSFNVRHSSRAKWFDDECHEKKQLYNEALRQFNIYKTVDTRHVLCDRKKEYKKTVRRKRRAFKFAEMRKIEKLRNKRPKDFWALFRHRKAAKGEELSLEEFYNHFRNLANDINIVNNEEAEQFCTSNDFNKNDPVFEELDSSITAAEVEKCMNSLKQGKACGTDNLLNEYFLEAGDILLSHITDLFNAILDSGCFPDNWTEGIIVPLFKKGDENDVNNFRAVTLVSCLSKLFTAVLNKRVNDWSEKYNTVSDAQFGFKKGFSTVDAIYTLHSLIQNMLNNNKRLYCAFVDLKKAFDSVYHNALWLKLYKLGINGKFLRIIRAMYDSVKCCVKHCGSYSEFFEVSVGLKQGETLSPILFSLFIEDLELYLQGRPGSGLNIKDINLLLLLFADDMVVLGETPEDLQNSLNELYRYCNHWGLEATRLKRKSLYSGEEVDCEQTNSGHIMGLFCKQ